MKRIFIILGILAAVQHGFCENNNMRASMKLPSAPARDVSFEMTIDDIRQTLGLVPDFFKKFSPQALPGAWQTFKAVQLNNNTAIPCKYKELIGLAVSSQIPCHYCEYFHTDAAKLNGAGEAEVGEAVALASVEREWSTIIHGSNTDLDEFKRLTDHFIDKVRKGELNISFDSRPLNSPEDAYKEIEAAFGTVPAFIRQFPREGVTGLWAELKSISLNPHTAIPAKYKDLISLAVSAQVPCEHCIYFDTQAARADGASENEINEAIAMAALTRHWSTALNGMQTNDQQFRTQIREVFTHAKNAAAREQRQTAMNSQS